MTGQTRMMLASLCLLIGAAVGAGGLPARAETSPGASRRPVPDLGVMLNDDGDWSFTSLDPEQSRRDILAAIDALAGTPVKTYLRCVGLGSDTLYYPTEAASVAGWRDDPTGRLSDYLAKVRAGIASGVDPIRLAGERCKELGIYFFPSVRMNDAHFAKTAPIHPLTGEFWMKHHEQYTLKSPKNWLNFQFQEVRDYRLGIIFEVIDRYQDVMDGIELDFNRHPLFFPRGSGMTHADLLTEMVAKVRAKLDEVGQERGRPYYLIVRVNPTLETCHYSALDVERWMREGLVDVIVPAQLYDLSYDMRIEELVRLGRSTGVKVYPAIYPRTEHVHAFVQSPSEADYSGKTTHIPSVELLRGAASNLWHLGADGFELYNFRTPPGPLGYQAHRVFADPAALTMQDRLYMITPGKPTLSNEEAKQIPASLTQEQPISLKLLVGEDFKNPDKPIPSYVGLRIGLRDLPSSLSVRVSLNGRVIHDGPAGKKLTRVTSPPHGLSWRLPLPEAYLQIDVEDRSLLEQGWNSITLELLGPPADKPVQVQAVQLGVLYKNPFNRRL
ncbi:MAG TPA: hypothetical protein VF184_07655 [Phycisphaeraceae bacterium]